MKVSRRFFDRLLWVGAVLMAIISLVIITTAIQTVRETSQNMGTDPAFSSNQVEFEMLALIDTLDRFGDDPQSTPQNEVLEQFSNLWSRIFDENSVERHAKDEAAIAEIQDIRAAFASIEPQIRTLKPNNPDQVTKLKAHLRSLLPLENDLLLATANTRAKNDDMYVNNQLNMSYLVLFFSFGMILFGILSITLLRVDRIQISSMNARLEKRVRQRTEELRAANSRLAEEIGERKRTQALATEREARLEQAVRLAKLGYYIWDTKNDRCEFCSDQHAAAFGLTPAEFIAQTDSHEKAMLLIHPEDRDMLNRQHQDLRNGKAVETEYRVLNRTGVRRLRKVARPISDSAGQVHREVGSTIDITDQYDTEMKLFEAQKMDMIGKMTGGVAHDFNNLLAIILGNLELLKEVPDIDDREEMIEDAINATLRGRDLTMSMLSFARRAPLDPSNLNLNEILSEIQGMLRRTLPGNITIRVNLSPNIWTVESDRSLTESAVLNLVINARDAMPDGGTLTIETENVTLKEDQAVTNPEDLPPGHYVRMTVKDTGRGISTDLLPHIFEPFFTTKSITNNSGLGLSMVQGFISQTGGAIRLASEPDFGTTFHLYFKAILINEASGNPRDLPKMSSKPKPARVLLVEDNDTVRKVLALQIEKGGMTVSSASESVSAEIAFKTDGPFDIVVSDIIMPGEVQGPDLIKRLRKLQPNLPAILISGYPQNVAIQNHGAATTDVLLMKPVSRDELVAAINTAMSPEAVT